MPPIRNSCVARGTTAAAGFATLYTVPANTVLLLKDIRLGNTNTLVLTVTLYLDAVGAAPLIVVAAPSLTSQGFGSWSGWVAVNAGDSVLLNCTDAGIQYWLSGALLPFVPGF